MNQTSKKPDYIYRPFLFTFGVFIVTWCCAFLMEITDYSTHKLLFLTWDFLENASPMICALFLLRRELLRDHFLLRFFAGTPCRITSYLIVFVLFAAQFLNFYFFRLSGNTISVPNFLFLFFSQLFLGGGLEEAGWRGYLLPCLCKKHHVLSASVMVSFLWVIWHLPYFFLPGTIQEGQNLIAYAVIGILTGFILTAIYLLTNSVLLCMLFHSWQNTIVMVIPANTENIWFLLTFAFLGILSILLCLFYKPLISLRFRGLWSKH